MQRSARTTLLAVLAQVLGTILGRAGADRTDGSAAVFALAMARGRLFAGSRNGEIGVFARSTPAQRERRAADAGSEDDTYRVPAGVKNKFVRSSQVAEGWEDEAVGDSEPLVQRMTERNRLEAELEAALARRDFKRCAELEEQIKRLNKGEGEPPSPFCAFPRFRVGILGPPLPPSLPPALPLPPPAARKAARAAPKSRP